MSKTLTYTNASAELGLKNPALWRDQDGVLYSQCIICNAYIGNEFEMDMYSLIRKKYCDTCAKDVQRKQRAEYMKRARENKRLLRQNKRKLEIENEKLRELNAQLDERLAELESRLEEIKK